MADEVSSPPPLPVAGVKVVQVPGKGRGMRATSSFKPGDVILDEEPYASIPMNHILDQPVCQNDLMFVEESSLKTCQACNKARYSSKAAQKSDWRRGHKYECKALQSPNRPLSMLSLAARVLWKRGAEMKAAAKAKAEAPAAAASNASLDESMQSGGGAQKDNADDSAPGYWQSYEAVAAMQGGTSAFAAVPRPALLDLLGGLRYYLSKSKAPHYSDEKLQEQLMMQVMSNAFAVPDMEKGISLGVGLYPMGALLNHSSRRSLTGIPDGLGHAQLNMFATGEYTSWERRRPTGLHNSRSKPQPNCGQTFFKGRLQIRALQAISPGDELQISYTDVLEPTFVKRLELLQRYSFDLRPELPRDNKFPGARSETLSGCVHTGRLDASAAAALVQDELDAAHCAVHSAPSPAGGLAPGATRFCSITAKPASDFNGMGAFGPMTMKEELESNISVVAAHQVLREPWLPKDGMAAWLDQLMNEDWKVDVMLLGDWAAAEEWQAVAYAAAFCAAAHAWSTSLLERGEEGLTARLLAKAEQCGREAGLADSHTAMRPLLLGALDAFLRQGEMVQPGKPLPAGAKQARQYANRCEAALRAVYPPGSGELGWDLDKVGEVIARCGDMPRAQRLWQEGAGLLRGAFGEVKATIGVIFKAEYFRDNNMKRKMELVERLGPMLPERFTRAM